MQKKVGEAIVKPLSVSAQHQIFKIPKVENSSGTTLNFTVESYEHKLAS